ncbi:class I SAM-dependent methyltransferase [Rubrobacter marinus]|nr:class I SAM-dependent methyltransferase [Rubrobacter marinus]
MAVIGAAFDPLAGKRVLDVGCGAGVLARSLSAQGARVVGVDPNEQALALAREAVPEGKFYRAGAQELPFADRSFDGAVFLNSLHHVPEPGMHAALREAARVVKPGGNIVVIEPLATGSFFSVLRLAEDETRVRAAAQKAVGDALDGGTVEPVDRAEYVRRERFADADQFLARIIAVDPARAPVVDERRDELVDAFRRHARRDAHGRWVLEQPLRAHVFTARS